jgi:replicative DNA helicase
MKKDTSKLDALAEVAVEGEIEEGRHEREAAVLATVARHGLNNADLWHGFAALTWSRADHKAIAGALWENIVEGTKPDKLLIRTKLKDAGARVEDAVLSGILEDDKLVRDVSVAVAYIRSMDREDLFVRADDMVRDLKVAVEKAKAEGGDVDAAVAGLLKDAFALAHGKKLVREYPVEADGIADFLSDLDARRTDGLLGLDCGIRHLNEVLNGLTEGVFILAGMPSCGKTTLAKQIADHVAAVGKVPVLFWSFEQSKEELRIKSLARLTAADGSGVNSRDIWKGRASDADTWAKVEKAAEAYRRGPGRWLTIIEAGREDTLDRIRSVAVMAKHKAGKDADGKDKKVLLVLDYLQIIPAGKDAPEDTRARIDWNLSELRRLSRDLKSPVLVISSLSRAGYGEPSKPPTITALKESGGIEYTADAVICLWRNDEESGRLEQDRLTRRPDDPKTVRVEAHVLKNRNGEVGSKVKLDFTPAWADFQPAGE